ncbi:hypothetical protein D3C80_1239640 [compost metagenome]
MSDSLRADIVPLQQISDQFSPIQPMDPSNDGQLKPLREPLHRNQEIPFGQSDLQNKSKHHLREQHTLPDRGRNECV